MNSLKLFVYVISSHLLMSIVAAENSSQFSPYTIHHNALTTEFLSPEVAKQYHIKRSTHHAMINISVLKNQSTKNIGTAVSANVEVKMKNLIGQITNIPVRQIKEGSAIYYIGDFPVADRQHLTFHIKVKPIQQKQVYQMKIQHTFFTE